MRVLSISAVILVLAVLAVLVGSRSCQRQGMPTGTYQVDTFRFVQAAPQPSAGTAEPHVWIDANTELSGLSGGTLTSSLPCSIRIDYTDNSRTFKAIVFTTIAITYEDGMVEPAAESAKLPLRITSREYETVNSMAGGRIVKTSVRVLSGKFPKVIARDKPLRLQLGGYFERIDGTRVEFATDQQFDVVRERAVKRAADVLQDK